MKISSCACFVCLVHWNSANHGNPASSATNFDFVPFDDQQSKLRVPAMLPTFGVETAERRALDLQD